MSKTSSARIETISGPASPAGGACACCAPEQGKKEQPEESVPVLRLSPRFQAAVLLASALLLALLLIFPPPWPWNWPCFLLPYLACGYRVLLKAGESLKRGDFFNEFTLMSAATVAALILGELPEALGVMLFYQSGELLQEKAVSRSRGSIRALLAGKPGQAKLWENGEVREISLEAIRPGQTLLVAAGEQVPVDGVVLGGGARIDLSPLTGESLPVYAAKGRQVFGGCLALDGHIIMSAAAAYKDSQLARILDLVEQAQARKSRVERFITRLARVYTPIVFALALALALLPPLLGWGEYRQWIYRGLVLLVISCPCALVISVPLSYFGGLGAAARQGILVKGGNVLDALNRIKAVAFDKTGTLTQGRFQVSALAPAPGSSAEELLEAAQVAQAASSHPLAQAIMKFNASRPLPELSRIKTLETPGRGVEAWYEHCRFLAGSRAFLREKGVDLAEEEKREDASLVYVARGGRFLGRIMISDEMKEDAAEAVTRIKEMGLACYLLSGDREEPVRRAAERLGMTGYRAGLLPGEKIKALDELAGLERAMFVGDGVNDAPLLANAGVGVAMGGLGSAAAMEAADAVILNDAPSRVLALLKTAARSKAVAWQNIILALGVKALIMLLGATGAVGLWGAVFADVGVALLAVLNSTRTLRGGE
ncbi:MAG: cadmium-translocating P-type ATPase [Desulfarculales bacterium]|jgi:Cd2+/Zn2+-exporting ATPase|nr:cadmium-translocating P-type ATPase [Desulfarculales bacterium]